MRETQELVCLVYLVDLVYLVYPVYLVEPHLVEIQIDQTD